jgi:alpha-tubulin suppressor-like RCC1 family protein
LRQLRETGGSNCSTYADNVVHRRRIGVREKGGVMKVCIWRFGLLLAVLALVGSNASSAAASLSSSAGVAWDWGFNQYGQLGSNTTDPSTVPVAVQMPANVTFTTVSAGGRHVLALDTAGYAWAWGDNSNGELGNNSTDESLVPVAVQMPANVMLTAISAGAQPVGKNHELALDSAGHAWAWGYNGHGELGNNSTDQSLVPVAVNMPANATFTTISAGFEHSLALDAAGHAWAWGHNSSGELGNNSRDQSLLPVAVNMPANVTFTALSAGYDRSFALDTAGHAWAWGDNSDGALGINSTGQSLLPVAVDMPANVAFTTISAGYDHSLALDTAGDAWTWGNNKEGELGTSTVPTSSPAPVAVQMPANVTFTTVSAGYYFSLALDTAGHGWAWGVNGAGKLGNNSSDPSQVPVAVQMPPNVTFSMISAGAHEGLALQPLSDQ